VRNLYNTRTRYHATCWPAWDARAEPAICGLAAEVMRPSFPHKFGPAWSGVRAEGISLLPQGFPLARQARQWPSPAASFICMTSGERDHGLRSPPYCPAHAACEFLGSPNVKPSLSSWAPSDSNAPPPQRMMNPIRSRGVTGVPRPADHEAAAALESPHRRKRKRRRDGAFCRFTTVV
jgi:hypothetical protein